MTIVLAPDEEWPSAGRWLHCLAEFEAFTNVLHQSSSGKLELILRDFGVRVYTVVRGDIWDCEFICGGRCTVVRDREYRVWRVRNWRM